MSALSEAKRAMPALAPLDGCVGVVIAGEINIQGRSDPNSAFVAVTDTLSTADILLGHLEGPFAIPSTDPAAPDIAHKEGWRHSDPSQVQGLVGAGFDAVSCASNVSYPAVAALTTLNTLATAGIASCGIGRTEEEAHRPAIVEVDGLTVGLLSYTSVFWPSGHAAGTTTPGVSVIRAATAYQPGRRALEMPGAPPIVVTIADADDVVRLQQDIRALRGRVDVVIVSCHWGVSGSEQPVDYQYAVGRAAIEAGADVVFGHHPHVIQRIELYRDKPIFYSVGNFVFDWQRMHGRHLDGLLLRLDFRDRRIARIRFVPCQRDEANTIRILDPASGSGHEILQRLQALSLGGVSLTVEGADVVLDLPKAREAETGQRAAATAG